MPSDSEHPMQKPLRAYAERRRAEAGEPALHAVNRRLLQAEVARQYSSGPAASRPRSRFWIFWPRLAFAAAVCLAIGFVLWNATSDRAGRGYAPTMAQLDSASDRKRIEPTGSPAAPSPGDAVALFQQTEASPAPTGIDRGQVRSLAPAEPLTRGSEPAPEAKAPAATPPSTPRLAVRGGDAPMSARVALPKEAPAPLATRSSPDAGIPAPGAPLQAGTRGAALGGAAKADALNMELARGNTETRFFRTEAPAAPAPVAVTPPPSMPLPQETEAAVRSRAASLASREATPPPASAVRSRGLTGEASQSLASVPARQSYQFTVAPTAALSLIRGGAPAPLAAFDFEQSGDRVRLFETDGSIYTGSVLVTNRALFRVTGTNRSHGRMVTVEGTFLQDTQALRRVAVQAAPRFGAGPAPASPAPAGGGAGVSGELQEHPAGAALELRVRTEGMAEQTGVAMPVAKPAAAAPAQPAPAGGGVRR